MTRLAGTASSGTTALWAAASPLPALSARAASCGRSSPRSGSACGACRSAPSSARAPPSTARARRASSITSASERSAGGRAGRPCRHHSQARPGGRRGRLAPQGLEHSQLDLGGIAGAAASLGVHHVQRRQLQLGQQNLVRPHHVAGRIELLHPAAHAGGRSQQAGRPRVEHRFGRGASRHRQRGPAGRRRRLGREQQRHAMGHRHTGARCTHDVQLGRRRLPAGDRIERAGTARQVATQQLVHALGAHRVGDGVDGVVERASARRTRRRRGSLDATPTRVSQRSSPSVLSRRCSSRPSTTARGTAAVRRPGGAAARSF